MSQNIILLGHVDRGAELFRLISIVKMRDSQHDSRSYEFRIEDGGLSIADTFRSAEQILTGTAGSEAPVQRRATALRKKGRKQTGR